MSTAQAQPPQAGHTPCQGGPRCSTLRGPGFARRPIEGVDWQTGPMPTYTVRTATGRLDVNARERLAQQITAAHTAATGAPGFFAQVVFDEVDSGRHFVGGVPLADEVVFVQGQIRDGRTPEQKHLLLDGLIQAVTSTLGVKRRSVWVYLLELPPTNMVEYGYVLPAAGGESAWLASLAPEDREHLGA